MSRPAKILNSSIAMFHLKIFVSFGLVSIHESNGRIEEIHTFRPNDFLEDAASIPNCSCLAILDCTTANSDEALIISISKCNPHSGSFNFYDSRSLELFCHWKTFM